MIQLIIGEKGNGKTKLLVNKANTEIKEKEGNVVYLDKSKQHMFEVNNRVRLIDVTEFPVRSTDAFIGFICGIISQDHDLEQVYLDSFLKIAAVTPETMDAALVLLEEISKKYSVDFVISISVTRDQLSEHMQSNILIEV